MWPADKYAPGRSQDSYDKQPVRDWLISVGLQGQAGEGQEGGRAHTSAPALLPQDLIDLVSGQVRPHLRDLHREEALDREVGQLKKRRLRPCGRGRQQGQEDSGLGRRGARRDLRVAARGSSGSP